MIRQPLVVSFFGGRVARAFGVICDEDEFSDVMEIPVEMLSPKKYEMAVSIDVTEPGGKAILTMPNREII